MFTNILVPTDGSPLSRKTIAAAVELAKALDAKITGLFAAPPATPIVYRNSLPVGYTTPRQHAQMIKESADRYLNIIKHAADKARVRCELLQVTSDYPADAILETAKKKKCDLIVMATHGHRGIKGLILGSETQKVLTHAKIPVMVYR